MPIRDRCDEPDSWHHVMNRALARRTMFENAQDMRFYLAQAALVARMGLIEIHAYSLLSTHFHLLARSPIGRLSKALHLVELRYVRYFNRTRRRDGPLVRSRFFSKSIESMAYRRAVVRYIDANAVAARLVDRAEQYEFCSARHYARRAGPPWLARDWIEQEVCGEFGIDEYQPGRYASCFGDSGDDDGGRYELIERRLVSGGPRTAVLDDLVNGSRDVLEWMQRKARLADGTTAGEPIVPASTVDRFVGALSVEVGTWVVRRGRGPALDLWRCVRVFLLREICGLSLAGIARRCRVTVTTVRRDRALGRRLLVEDESFAERCRLIAADSLSTCYGRPTSKRCTT